MGRPGQVCCSASPLCVLGSLIPGLWQCPHAAPTRMHARTSFDSRSLRKEHSQVIRVHLSQVTQKSVTGSLLDWLHCGSHKATTGAKPVDVEVAAPLALLGAGGVFHRGVWRLALRTTLRCGTHQLGQWDCGMRMDYAKMKSSCRIMPRIISSI